MKRTKFKRTMKRLGVSSSDLAVALCYTVGTIRNIDCGASENAVARQRITNFLRTPDIWPGIRLTESDMIVTAGSEFTGLTTLQIREAERRLGAAIVAGNNKITVAKPIVATISFARSAPVDDTDE